MIKELDLSNVPSDKLENAIDEGIRHKSGTTSLDYLKSFLRISRQFAYATYDESWGEFEKEFTIIVRRMIVAERKLEELGLNEEEE